MIVNHRKQRGNARKQTFYKHILETSFETINALVCSRWIWIWLQILILEPLSHRLLQPGRGWSLRKKAVVFILSCPGRVPTAISRGEGTHPGLATFGSESLPKAIDEKPSSAKLPERLREPPNTILTHFLIILGLFCDKYWIDFVAFFATFVFSPKYTICYTLNTF